NKIAPIVLSDPPERAITVKAIEDADPRVAQRIWERMGAAALHCGRRHTLGISATSRRGLAPAPSQNQSKAGGLFNGNASDQLPRQIRYESEGSGCIQEKPQRRDGRCRPFAEASGHSPEPRSEQSSSSCVRGETFRAGAMSDPSPVHAHLKRPTDLSRHRTDR